MVTSKNNVMLTAGLLLVVLVCVGFAIRDSLPLIESSSETQSKEEAVVAAKNKATVVKRAPTDTGDKSSTHESYSAPDTANGITVTAEQQTANVIVATKLNGYSDGECSVTAENAGKTTTQSAPVVFQREFSTCAGFSISTSTLGSGNWKVTLSVTSGGKTNSKSIRVAVQ